MYCVKCGKELRDEAVMCPSCGNLIADKLYKTPAVTTQTAPKNNVFAKISNVLSTIALALCWTGIIPIILFEASLPLAIVGLCLKNKFPNNSHLTKRALIKSIVAFAVGLTFFIVYLYLFIFLWIYFVVNFKGCNGCYYYPPIINIAY